MRQKYEIICIYCLGEYGIQTYLKLKDRGIQVSLFGDRDLKKQGYVVDGISCVSYETVVELDKERTLIIVATKNPQSIINEFRNKGFMSVISKDEALCTFECKNNREIQPLTDMREILNLKEVIANVFYQGGLPESGDEQIQQMLVDFNKRN